MQTGAAKTRFALCLIALAGASLMLWPGVSMAAPPSITEVTYTGRVNVAWTLPEGMRTYAIEVATRPETYGDGDGKGSFRTESWAQSAILFGSEQTVWSGRALPAGTYYVHVSAFDAATCTSPLALGCAKEWSTIAAFSAPQRFFGLSLEAHDRTPYMSWSGFCCQPQHEISLVEIATDRAVYPDGPLEGLFLDENLVLSDVVPSTATSYAVERPMAGGTYFMHAVGVDRSYCPTDDPTRDLCRDEVSRPIEFRITPTPPQLNHPTIGDGAIRLSWFLPAGMRSDFIEVATAPDVYENGPLRGAFLDENLVLFDDALFPNERSYTTEPLPPGTYYVHVAAYVAGSCYATEFPPCVDDYSSTARITIPSPTIPMSTTGPAAAGVDKAVAFSLLQVRRVQGARRLSVRAVIEEDASVQVSGRVSISRFKRGFRLKQAKVEAKAGHPVTLRLRLSKRVLAIVRRAIARDRLITARLTITARDRIGNVAEQIRTVKLRG